MKKLIFGIIATVFMSALSVNAQDRPINPKDLIGIDLGLGLVSPTFGDCMEAPAFCSRGTGSPIDLNTSFVAMSKTSKNTIMIVFSDTFYQENKQNLAKGLVVEKSTVIQNDLAKDLGFEKAVTVDTNLYKIVKKDGFYTTQIRVK